MEKNSFCVEKIKNIIIDIKNILEKNIGPVVKTIDDDNQTFMEKTSYSKLISIIDQINSEKWCLEKSSKKNIIEGVGNIAVVYNEDPCIFFYLCLKALKTNNNIIFIQTQDEHKITLYLTDIINKALGENNYNVFVKIKKLKQLRDVEKYESQYDKFICVGDSKNYRLLKKYTDKEVIYNAYGTMSLYMDDKSLKNKLLEIDDYVFENNIRLSLYTKEPVEDVVKLINESEENFCSVIFSKDIKKVAHFINKVRADMVFVNKNPSSEYKFEIEDIKLVKIKRIFI